MFLSGVCSGHEKNARQHLVVHVPGAVQMTETSSLAKNAIDLRIETSGDIAIGVDTESLPGRRNGRSDSVVILHSGRNCVIRFRTEPVRTAMDSAGVESDLDYKLPPGQRVVLTVSSL